MIIVFSQYNPNDIITLDFQELLLIDFIHF